MKPELLRGTQGGYTCEVVNGAGVDAAGGANYQKRTVAGRPIGTDRASQCCKVHRARLVAGNIDEYV